MQSDLHSDNAKPCHVGLNCHLLVWRFRVCVAFKFPAVRIYVQKELATLTICTQYTQKQNWPITQ